MSRPILLKQKIIRDLIEYDKGLTEYNRELNANVLKFFNSDDGFFLVGASDTLGESPLESDLSDSNYTSQMLLRRFNNANIKCSGINLGIIARTFLPNRFFHSIPTRNTTVFNEYLRQFNPLEKSSFCDMVIKELTRFNFSRNADTRFKTRLYIFWMTQQFYKEIPYSELTTNYLKDLSSTNMMWILLYAMLRRNYPEVIADIKKDFFTSYQHHHSLYDLTCVEIEEVVAKNNPGYMPLVIAGLFSGSQRSMLARGLDKHEEEISECAIAMTDSGHQAKEAYFPNELHNIIDIVEVEDHLLKEIFCTSTYSLTNIIKVWDKIDLLNEGAFLSNGIASISLSVKKTVSADIAPLIIKDYLGTLFEKVLKYLTFIVELGVLKENSINVVEEGNKYVYKAEFNLSKSLLEMSTFSTKILRPEANDQVYIHDLCIFTLLISCDDVEKKFFI